VIDESPIPSFAFVSRARPWESVGERRIDAATQHIPWPCRHRRT